MELSLALISCRTMAAPNSLLYYINEMIIMMMHIVRSNIISILFKYLYIFF